MQMLKLVQFSCFILVFSSILGGDEATKRAVEKWVSRIVDDVVKDLSSSAMWLDLRTGRRVYKEGDVPRYSMASVSRGLVIASKKEAITNEIVSLRVRLQNPSLGIAQKAMLRKQINIHQKQIEELNTSDVSFGV